MIDAETGTSVASTSDWLRATADLTIFAFVPEPEFQDLIVMELDLEAELGSWRQAAADAFWLVENELEPD